MGAETAAIIGTIASVIGAGTTAVSALSSKGGAKKPALPVQNRESTEDVAKQRLEEEELLRKRRGRASTLLQGEGVLTNTATTQTGGKTLLG